MKIQDLKAIGFDVETRNHAMAVLDKDFPDPTRELCTILSTFQIFDHELIRGGGGESTITQRLRRALNEKGWPKRNVSIRKIVNGDERPSESHEIDHVRKDAKGSVALEIEWNNKDPFFDRDLENFQRLHAEGVISIGIMITRGASLQDEMRSIVMDCVKSKRIKTLDDLRTQFNYNPTPRQRSHFEGLTGNQFLDAWVPQFVGDKFGTATTHWSKLQDRLSRGVGNPCPLLLIGIPASVVERTFS